MTTTQDQMLKDRLSYTERLVLQLLMDGWNITFKNKISIALNLIVFGRETFDSLQLYGFIDDDNHITISGRKYICTTSKNKAFIIARWCA